MMDEDNHRASAPTPGPEAGARTHEDDATGSSEVREAREPGKRRCWTEDGSGSTRGGQRSPQTHDLTIPDYVMRYFGSPYGSP